MEVIKYAEYVDYDRRRQEANTAINAMLAGCRLASHFLALTHGATRPLGEIFPNIPRIRLFNLRTDVASGVLDDAEHHLGLMAVPLVQAIHEDFGVGCLKLLRLYGLISRDDFKSANAGNLHDRFESAAGTSLEGEAKEIYQLLRLLRNSVVHRGGTASLGVEEACEVFSSSAWALWTKVTTQAAPVYAKGEVVRLGFSETIAALAVTKRLARQMNLALGTALPRTFWLDRLITDFVKLRGVPPQPAKRIEVAHRLGRFNYAPLGFDRGEVEAELRLRGLVQ
ncbi:hypothetical protein EXU48_09920 [Occultella glacieicola]|uniref:Apea-like HEPN domain-containing protein n=1 Tax=Occultella glacieicola TaxID=2518684 RepID=A0ABY2E597_9MICO|nr:hypothetical protein [Occultella glacieicola]TDE95071.1 hypothetical protein EXU48_09920 [Occultella glacieicola]